MGVPIMGFGVSLVQGTVKEIVTPNIVSFTCQGYVLKAHVRTNTGAVPVVGDTIVVECLPNGTEWEVIAIL